MNIVFLRRAGIACLAFVAVAVLVLMMPATRLAAHSSGMLDACINPGNGMMRLVDSSAACHANEKFVEWNITGPQGPAGPQGPQGPAGPQGPPGASSGGPPFVWVCTPATLVQPENGNGFTFIFNGSSMAAKVAANFLNKDGTNLSGSVIPGSNPVANYPGQTGSNTVSLASHHTLFINYQTGNLDPASGGAMLATVLVTSDQPVTVSSTLDPSAVISAFPCALLPK